MPRSKRIPAGLPVRISAALFAIVIACLLAPAAVVAHAELETATPGPGDEVVGSPDEIVATFTQDLDMSRTALVVRNAAGEVVAEGPVRGDGQREIRLALPELPPGAYEVRWTSFSAEDGEIERGRYTFTVLPGPSPTQAPTAAATATATSVPSTLPPATSPPTATITPGPGTPQDSDVAAVVPIGIAAIALLVIGAWLLRRR